MNLLYGFLKIYEWSKQQYFNKRLIMTNEDEDIYNNSSICHICKEELNTDKVRDHCHMRGKSRGVSHNKCSLNLRLPKNYQLFFIIYKDTMGI